MEPQIRYLKNTDGTRLGYWALGRGRPLVIMPSQWIFSIHTNWEVPEIRANLEHLAQKRTVVQYDARGQGTSSREVTDFTDSDPGYALASAIPMNVAVPSSNLQYW